MGGTLMPQEGVLSSEVTAKDLSILLSRNTGMLHFVQHNIFELSTLSGAGARSC
jgi:hypothetical protein